MDCPACGDLLPAGARFCPSCGTQVDLPTVSTTEERRVVTVLFADLVGYTALSEHLDPERVKRLIDGAFERLVAEIERFGGRVDKVLGDGILALFGAPRAHEDDPERAVRAAIELHRALREHVAGSDGPMRAVRLRVGVNAGEEVVGSASRRGDYKEMGEVGNVASRLQAMAPPGGTYIGSSTEAALPDSLERQLVADAEVRGRERTERVWHVTRRVLGDQVGHGRRLYPFVGREAPRRLLGSIMSLVSGGRGAVVSVVGEAGSGKTRFVDAMIERFPASDVIVYSGACAPYGETNVWAPIAGALFRALDVERTVSSTMLRDTVRERASVIYGFDETDIRLNRFVEGAMHLFGHPSELDRMPAMQARELLMQVVVEGVNRRASISPVVVWIDDLQWADPLLLELLGRLGRSVSDRPALLVTAQRDDAENDWPPAADHPMTITIPLDPLERDEADRLVASIVGDVDPSTSDELYERSGGNPLFLTELASAARDQPGERSLPSSLRGLIAARLAALPISQRRVVDNAAVLGASGPISALGQFAEALQQPFAADDIDGLVDDGIFDVRDGWWSFRSDVVREVAYQTLTKSARAERHAGTAGVMYEFGLAPIDRIAHHAASAAELIAEIGAVESVPDDIDRRAVKLLLEAARRSLEIGAFHQSIRQATRGLELGLDDSAIERSLLLVRAEAALERRETAGSTADIEAARESALADRDRADEAVARRLLGIAAQIGGDLRTARVELDRSVELTREVGDHASLATALSDRGFVEVFGGSLADADRYLRDAETLADELDDRRRLAWIRQHQAWVAFLSGDTDLAEQRLVAASSLFEEFGDRSGSGWATGLLAYVRFFERRLSDAEQLASDVRREAAEFGDRWAPAMMDALVASIRLWTGRFSEAEELSRRALVAFRDLNDRFGIVQALAPRMRALVALGRSHEAERGLEEAMSLADAFGDLALPTMAAAGTAAHLGLGERVVALGETALERMSSMGAETSESLITLALGHCQAGDPETALAVLIDVSDDRPYAAAVRSVAAAMTGADDVALESARRVVDDEEASYLDQVMAGIAGAAASRRQPGDASLEVVEEWLASARTTAEEAGDVVAIALAKGASAALLHPSMLDDDVQVEHIAVGWRRIIDGLAAPDRCAN